MKFGSWFQDNSPANPEYVAGWDGIIPSFHGKWTRTDKTPRQWAAYMIEKLEAMNPEPRIQGSIDALKAYLKHGKVNFIGTTGHHTSNSNSPPPFSQN